MTIEYIIGAVVIAAVVAYFLFRQPAEESVVEPVVETPEPEPAKVETVVEVDAKTVKVTKASLSKLTKQGLEDLAKAESEDPSEQTLEVNLEEQPDSLAPVVEMPKSAKRGTRKTSSKTTRTRKRQPAKRDTNDEEQSSSKSEAEVSEIDSSLNRSANVSDDQVELQPDEKTVASKVG